jgi:hypothetical protein
VGRPVTDLCRPDDGIAVVTDAVGRPQRWQVRLSDARTHAGVGGRVLVARPIEESTDPVSSAEGTAADAAR